MSFGTLWSTSTVTAADGVTLAIYEAGPRDAPTVLAVHGYPDDHHVWDGVVELLATHLRVVSFDVRGAGASDVPSTRAGYRLDQLAADIALVAETTTTGQVHLLGHDWGSVACWHAATRDGAADRFASLTSISGPDLAYTRAWFRRGWRNYPIITLGQARRSLYTVWFRLPLVGELIWRSRLGHRKLGPTAPSRSIPDALHGLQLYRANLARRAATAPRPCELSVMVLAPVEDKYISTELQAQAPSEWTPDLIAYEIKGGHWEMTGSPNQVHDLVTEFIKRHPATESTA